MFENAKPAKNLASHESKNLFELTVKDLIPQAQKLTHEALNHPKQTLEYAAKEVGTSAAFGLVLGAVLPESKGLSLAIGAAMTLPIVKNGFETVYDAQKAASKNGADVNKIADDLAATTVKGTANFGLSFAGGFMGSEAGVAIAKSDTAVGASLRGTQNMLVDSLAKTSDWFKNSLSLKEPIAFTAVSADSIASPLAMSNASSVADKLNMYFGDLHLHSRYSDGIGLPADIFAAEKAAGRDFAFVTDHNHVLARMGVEPGSVRAVDEEGTPIEAADPQEYADTFAQAAKITQNGQFVGGVGSEVGTIGHPDPKVGHIAGGNHMNIFDSPDFLKTNEALRPRLSFTDKIMIKLGLKSADSQPVITFNDNDYKGLIGQLQKMNIKDSTGQDPIMQFNHPRYKQDYNPQMPEAQQGHDFGAASFSSKEEWLKTMDPYVHTIEVMKGGALNPNFQAHVNPYYVTSLDYAGYLDKGFHLSPTYGADTHFGFKSDGTPLRIGNPPAATGILAPSLDKESLLDAMRNRRTIATTDFKQLSGILTANDNSVLMGDILPESKFGQLTPSVKVMGNVDPNAQYQLKIWSDPNIGDNQLATVVATKQLTGQQILDSNNQVSFDSISHTKGNKSLIYAEIDRVDPSELAKYPGSEPFGMVNHVEAQQWSPSTEKDFSVMAGKFTDGNDASNNSPYVDRLFTAPIWIEPKAQANALLAKTGFLSRSLIAYDSFKNLFH